MLPRWLGEYKQLIVTTRPATDEDDPDDMLLQDFQIEAIVQENFGNDKGLAVKANRAEIKRVKAYLKQAKDKPETKERFGELDEWLDDLYRKRFSLLRNEYLNLVKEKCGGMLPESELQVIPGSPQWVREKQKQKDKTKNKPKPIKPF